MGCGCSKKAKKPSANQPGETNVDICSRKRRIDLRFFFQSRLPLNIYTGTFSWVTLIISWNLPLYTTRLRQTIIFVVKVNHMVLPTDSRFKCIPVYTCVHCLHFGTFHRRARWGGGGFSFPQKHLNIEKLGKFLLNSTIIRAIFAEIRDKSGNLHSWIG